METTICQSTKLGFQATIKYWKQCDLSSNTGRFTTQMGAVGEPTAVGLGGQTLRSIAMLDE